MKITKNLIIKTVMVVFLLGYLGALYFSDYAKDVPMSKITERMEQNEDITSMQKRGKSDLQRYFSIPDMDPDSFFFYKAVSPMSVNEVMIVKASDKSQADLFLENAEGHLESQKNVFGAYGTDQMGLLGEASVGSKGNYVYYFCGPDASKWSDMFLSLI